VRAACRLPARDSVGVVVWITGLPGAGKSTLARRLRERLGAAGTPCALLDSDESRIGAGTSGDGPDGRERLYATLARLGALLANRGLVVLIPSTARRRAWRDAARALAPAFIEVHIRGAADAPDYEPPASPEVVADGGEDDEALEAILARIASV